jgi:hypothetical protein
MMDMTIDQLFGNFTFSVCETMMDKSDDSDIEMENKPFLEQQEAKLLAEVNNLKQHIIDLLDETSVMIRK